MKKQFIAVYKKTGKWYSAWVEEIPGVNTQGETLKEAKENLRDALKLTLETNRFLTSKENKKVTREPIAVSI